MGEDLTTAELEDLKGTTFPKELRQGKDLGPYA